MTQGLRGRSTPDLVVLALTVVVAFVIVASTVAGMVALLAGSSGETVVSLLKSVGELTGSLIAVIVGYVGGRGASALSGPGDSSPPKDPPEP